MALFSCSQEDILPDDADNGKEITTTVSVQVPELFKSRANNPDVYDSDVTYLGESGMPSIGNVDLKTHPLTFTVGIYIDKSEAGATEPSYVLVSKQAQTVSNDEAYFNFRLIKGQKYRIVAYADFKKDTGSEGTGEGTGDGNGEKTGGDTGEAGKGNLGDIDYTTELNNELSDAFFVSQDFTAAPNVWAILKRPFGKLRLVAHDFNTFAAGAAFEIKNVKVDFKRQPMLATTKFNAVSGEFNYNASDPGDFSKTATPVVYSQEYKADGTADYATVFTMYLPANMGTTVKDESNNSIIPQSWMYPLDVTVTYLNKKTGNEATITRSYDIDIPVKRNYLTTIDVENFWADNSAVKVSIDHRFDGEIDPDTKTTTVKTEKELQEAIDNILAVSPYKGKITLGSDIVTKELSGFVIDRINGGQIELDLNGHTITATGEGKRTYTDAYGNESKIGGVFAIRNALCQLIVIDSSDSMQGGIRYTGPNDNTAMPIFYCYWGGRLLIKGGTFITDTESEVVYVYESEAHHAWVLENGYKKYPDYATTQKTQFNSFVKNYTSQVAIHGGWFQNGETGTIVDGKNQNVTINAYNTRTDRKDETTGEYTVKGWEYYSKYLEDKGYPGWGPYKDVTFGYVTVYGGTFVEFNPALGDNICGNWLSDWVPSVYTVLKETVDGRSVYTVLGNKSPNAF